MCIYICIYIYTHIHTYIYTHTHTHTHKLKSSSIGRKGTLTVPMFPMENTNGSISACQWQSYATRIPLYSKHDCRNAIC